MTMPVQPGPSQFQPPQVEPAPAQPAPAPSLHAESVYAIWDDPTTYDHMTMGPPYLPEMRVRVASTEQDTIKRLVAQEVNASPLAQLYATMLGDYQSIPMGELAVLLTTLRAAAFVHQAHHWQTRGDNFFGDHLLYERLYNESLEPIDQLAERAVGSGSRLLVHPVVQSTQLAALVKFFTGDIQVDPSPDEYALVGLLTEIRVLAVLGMSYQALDGRDLLSHGTDNLLQDIADKHEGFVYLLRQRSQQKLSYDWRRV